MANRFATTLICRPSQLVKISFLRSSLLLEAFPVCSTIISRRGRRDQFGEKLRENIGKNPKNLEDIERMGLSKYLKKNRMYAQYNYQEWRFPVQQRAIDISCTKAIIEEYEDEKEGMMSKIKKPKKTFDDITVDYRHHRMLKKKIGTFHQKRFPAEAQEIYVKAHNLLNTENWTLAKKDDTEERLHNLVTEFAYPDMLKGLEVKTVKWEFIESIEPARVVLVRCSPQIHEDNLYAQVTVRFHTKQLLAIHDRFGRLMIGSAEIPRHVLEFVTFERHIANPHGKWRIHAKKLTDVYGKDEMPTTVAFMKRKPERLEADEWHKQEEEICNYKWYPQREWVIQKKQRFKIEHRGKKFWKRIRKIKVLTRKRVPRTSMVRTDMRRVGIKKSEIVDLRQKGLLPPPPK